MAFRPELYIDGQGKEVAVHPATLCAGHFCCIHNPSDHPLKNAPTNWNDTCMRSAVPLCWSAESEWS